jgi:hypothetical protein
MVKITFHPDNTLQGNSSTNTEFARMDFLTTLPYYYGIPFFINFYRIAVVFFNQAAIVDDFSLHPDGDVGLVINGGFDMRVGGKKEPGFEHNYLLKQLAATEYHTATAIMYFWKTLLVC